MGGQSEKGEDILGYVDRKREEFITQYGEAPENVIAQRCYKTAGEINFTYNYLYYVSA
jgi:hypothetical protein